MKIKIFPRKLYVTVLFKSGNKANFYCDSIKGSSETLNADGVVMSAADGKVLCFSNLEAVFMAEKRLWKIYILR